MRDSLKSFNEQDPSNPEVGVVIPTRNRHDLVVRAVSGVRCSTSFADVEVIVVVDGPDPDTLSLLFARFKTAG